MAPEIGPKSFGTFEKLAPSYNYDNLYTREFHLIAVNLSWQRQQGELQYAEVEHVTSGKSLPRKSSSEPIKPSNKEIVYADLV